MVLKLAPGDLEACDAAMRVEKAEEDLAYALLNKSRFVVDDGVPLISAAHPVAPWYRRLLFWARRPQLSRDSLETICIDPALHAAAPKGYLCADCTMEKEACPTCYTAWWKRRHPNVHQIYDWRAQQGDS